MIFGPKKNWDKKVQKKKYFCQQKKIMVRRSFGQNFFLALKKIGSNKIVGPY